MKKGETPQLSAKWWTKNKARTLGKTGLAEALRNYQISLEQDDTKAMLTALDKVKKTVDAAIKQCKPKTHAETLQALKKFDKVIADARKEHSQKQKKAPQQPQPAPQQFGQEVVIWKRDLGERVVVQLQSDGKKPAWLTLKGFEIAQKIDGQLLIEMRKEKDYITPQQIADDSEKLANQIAKRVKVRILEIDSLAQQDPKNADPKKMKKAVEKLIKAEMVRSEPQFKAIIRDRWNGFAKQRKQYSRYKIRSAVTIVTGVVGVAIGVGGLALGIAATAGAVPSMGGTLPLAIPGLAIGAAATLRSSIGLAKNIKDLGTSADKIAKSLKGHLETLIARYDNAKKTQIAAETGMSSLKAILGTDVPFMSSIPKCNDQFKLLEQKIAGLNVECRKLTKKIVDGLDKVDKLADAIKRLKDKKAKAAYKRLVQARRVLNRALDKCSDLGGKMTRGEKAIKHLRPFLDELNSKDTKFNKVFDKIAPRVTSIALALGSAGFGFGDAGGVAEFVEAGAGLVLDMGFEAGDLIDDLV